MPRLFVAVWPPERVLDVVAGLARPHVAGLRWTGRDQWHVTLRFLGAVDDPQRVIEALRGTIPVGGSRVEAMLGPAVGRFGSRVLHVPVSGLDRLAGRVVAATAGVGRPPDDREFAGHLTLARVAKGARVDLRRLAGQALAGGPGSVRWSVEDVCLVESHVGGVGPRYEVVEMFPVSAAG